MKKDKVIELAKQSLEINPGYNVWTLSTPHLEEFARLVAAAERERCAKFCDELDEKFWHESGTNMVNYGAFIRALK